MGSKFIMVFVFEDFTGWGWDRRIVFIGTDILGKV